MPWLSKKDGEKTCVYKKDADGKAEGDSLICYTGDDAGDKAKDYIKGLYAKEDHKPEIYSKFSGESLDQRLNMIRNSFYKNFSAAEGGGGVYPSSRWVREIYDSYVIVEDGDKLKRANYTIADGDVSFEDRSLWKPVRIDYVELQEYFLFTELEAKAEKLLKIDGLAEGTFTSMAGQEVTFESADFPAWVINTKEVIESTRTEKGEIVGLPIDLKSHDHQGGAGWIVDLEIDEARKVIRFVVKWTKAGIELIKGNVRRFFSPSTDPEEKVVLGGSLTNWPATRDQKGKLLLRPVELSQSLKEIDMEKTLEELQAENDVQAATIIELQGKIKSPAPAAEPVIDETEELAELGKWMEDDGEGVDQLTAQAQKRAELVINAEKRKRQVVEFVSKVVGGTKEKPFGLPVRAGRLVRLLLSLPEKQAKEVQDIIGLTYKGAIDFAEHGLDGVDYNFKPKLPSEFASVAQIYVEAGGTIEAWFEAMGDSVPGVAEEYNLTEFQKKED